MIATTAGVVSLGCSSVFGQSGEGKSLSGGWVLTRGRESVCVQSLQCNVDHFGRAGKRPVGCAIPLPQILTYVINAP